MGNDLNKDNGILKSKEKVRKVEKYLGIAGGICGIIGAIIAYIATLFHAATYSSDIVIAAIIFSVVGIVGGLIVNNNAKLSAIILIIVAIGLIVSIFYYGILGAALMLLGAVIALIRA